MDMSYVINTKDKPVPSKLIAINPNTGLPVELTAIQNDSTGEFNLPVVNIGHVAYNQVNDNYKIEDKTASKLLATHDFNYFETGGMSRWVGTTVSKFSTSAVVPIDISTIKDKLIVITNNHDTTINLVPYGMYSLDSVLSSEGVTPAKGTKLKETHISIPAGTTMVFGATELPLLNYPFVGLLMQIYRSANDTPGNVIVKVMGR